MGDGHLPPGLFAAPSRFTFDTTDLRLARAAWSRLAEPGDVVAGALVEALGPPGALDWVAEAAARPREAAAELALLEPGNQVARALEVRSGSGAAPNGRADAQDARRRATRSPARVLMTSVRRWATRFEGLAPERDLEAMDRMGGTLTIPEDHTWPRRVGTLGAAAPFALWVRGRPDLDAMTGRALSLVGSRASTGYGERVARDLADGLVARGFTVVSGGAHGIDAEAHRAALAVGGRTVVLLASGVDRLYPAGNRRLMEAATVDGAVVSEVPPGSTPFRQRFLARNRVIAALGGATVVVEAALRSGALSTANHAAGIMRPVGAVPGPVTSMASAGCHELLRSGAAVCVTDAAEAAELAGELSTDAIGPRQQDVRAGDGLDSVARAVLDALPVRRPAPVENVARVAGVAVDEARAGLGKLLVVGLATKEGACWRRTAR